MLSLEGPQFLAVFVAALQLLVFGTLVLLQRLLHHTLVHYK